MKIALASRELLEHPIEDSYTMQQVVELTGLSEHTLRYYERVGLIQSVRRDASSGHRRYAASDISRLETMACLRAVGMPIDQMRRYFALIPEGSATEKRQLLEAHQEVLEARMREMEHHLAYLHRKIAYWRGVEAQGDSEDAERCCTIDQESCAELVGHSDAE